MTYAWPTANRIVVALLICVGLVYVGKAWSPSSYGYILSNVLGTSAGPALGTPRPIRSDEYAVVTPLTQAVVRNDFARYNRTSLYGEDLRINYGLPLHDWGIVFKPTMWLYGLVAPAYAFSAHWFLVTALFFVGYAWLFRWLGASPVVGYALSAALYFTGVVQFWWSEKAPEFALFPWVVLSLSSRLPLYARVALFYWLAVSWLLANFYPPVQISLAFVGAILLLAKEPRLLERKTLLLAAGAAILAAGTAALYLWDYLNATATTIYPGSRRVSGQTLPMHLWLSWFLPTINFDRNFQSFVGNNVCENGTLGTYYLLMALCLLDLTKMKVAWGDPAKRRTLAVLAVGLVSMLSWMTLPIPTWAGVPLLWNHVQPQRMQFAAGLLAICLVLVLAMYLGLKWSLPRLAAILLLVGYGLWHWKVAAGKTDAWDLAIFLVAIGSFIASFRKPARTHASVALASATAGAVLFGGFNPLQSAHPIFTPPSSPVIPALDQLAAANNGVVAVAGLQGAVANGLGYKAVNHVTTTPQLSFWRRQFPEMAEPEFLGIFNRYSHIIAANEAAPRLLQDDAIIVPVGQFQKGLPADRSLAPPEASMREGGVIDSIFVSGGHVALMGWAPWTAPPQQHRLELFLVPDVPARATSYMVLRPDLPAVTRGKVAASNGFSLTIALDRPVGPIAMCLVAYDPVTGTRTLIRNPPAVPSCLTGGPR